ncbi:MAG: hypothetical protein QF352_08660, partial [Arenicellales bacterium]|nr:hypothetical protein [Arenicellales bacterium]
GAEKRLMKFSAPTTQISSATQSTQRSDKNSQFTYPSPKWEADREMLYLHAYGRIDSLRAEILKVPCHLLFPPTTPYQKPIAYSHR